MSPLRLGYARAVTFSFDSFFLGSLAVDKAVLASAVGKPPWKLPAVTEWAWKGTQESLQSSSLVSEPELTGMKKQSGVVMGVVSETTWL